jgi:hypothetical protein
MESIHISLSLADLVAAVTAPLCPDDVCPDDACPDAAPALAEVPPPAPLPPVPVSRWAVDQLGFHPSARQAEVLDSAERYLILCCNRQWGKSTAIAVKALHFAVHSPDRSVVVISRTKFQAGLLIQKLVRFAARLGFPVRRAFGERHSFLLPNGSYVMAVPHNADTSAGNTADVLVIDEAALVSDEVFASATPFMGRTKGSIWLLSTPRRQVGFFYNLWHDRDRRWRRVLSTVDDCPDIDRDFLRMQESLDPVRFRQDFYCEFIQPANRVIARQPIESMIDPDLDPWQIRRPGRT